MTFSKCPKCGHKSVKMYDDIQVVGVIQCSKTKRNAIMNRRRYGVKCSLCNYDKSTIMVTDSHGHRVSA
jgi:hypothetical protein